MEKDSNLLNLSDSQAKLVLVLLIIALGSTMVLSFLRGLNSSSPVDETRTDQDVNTTGEDLSQVETDLEAGWINLEKIISNQLEEILSQIRGAGSVKVKVFLQNGPLRKFEKDRQTSQRQTEEEDSSGGSRLVSEHTESGEVVFYRVSDGREERPVIQQIIKPKVEGVLVVASGADDSKVKLLLLRAVRTLLGIDSHQVEIIPGKGGG